MVVQYWPKDRLAIDNVIVSFGMKRDVVRARLSDVYLQDDQTINLGNDVLRTKRDVYGNISTLGYYYFLNYDENDSLREIEVHKCDNILVSGVNFDFDDDVTKIVSELKMITEIVRQTEGEYFFEELNIVLSNQSQMGGIGDQLAYFYATSNADHLR